MDCTWRHEGCTNGPGSVPTARFLPSFDPPPSTTHDGARTKNGVLACSRARVPKRAIAVVSPPRRLEPVLVGVARPGLVADGGGGGGRVGRGGAARPPVHSQRASSMWWRVAHAKPPSGELPSLSGSAREAAARQAPRHQLAYSMDANHFGDQVPAGPLLPSRRPTATEQRGGGIRVRMKRDGALTSFLSLLPALVAGLDTRCLACPGSTAERTTRGGKQWDENAFADRGARSSSGRDTPHELHSISWAAKKKRPHSFASRSSVCLKTHCSSTIVPVCSCPITYIQQRSESLVHKSRGCEHGGSISAHPGVTTWPRWCLTSLKKTNT